MTPPVSIHPEPPVDVRLILVSSARRLAERARATERMRAIGLLRAARDLNTPREELERAVAEGEEPAPFRRRLVGRIKARWQPPATDPARVLAWTRKALLSCLRARDEATLRAGVRQILRALLASHCRNGPR